MQCGNRVVQRGLRCKLQVRIVWIILQLIWWEFYFLLFILFYCGYYIIVSENCNMFTDGSQYVFINICFFIGNSSRLALSSHCCCYISCIWSMTSLVLYSSGVFDSRRKGMGHQNSRRFAQGMFCMWICRGNINQYRIIWKDYAEKRQWQTYISCNPWCRLGLGRGVKGWGGTMLRCNI